MILVIGERINDPRMSAKKVDDWQRLWQEHGWQAACRLTAQGGALRRLEQFLPPEGYRVVNLLPPDRVSGSWDAKEARRIAGEANFTGYQAVVLLGRRVAAAFLPGMAFGDIHLIAGAQALSLPHPSGRNNSFWLYPGNQDLVKEWLRNLLCFR